jgi:D-alanyl-D-alanine carboxypeptidase
MSDAIGKKVLVLYGYRSPARQVFIFFDILERIYNFDLDKTIRRVCFLDYSEHVCTKRQAIDFMTSDGEKGDDFDKSEEYQWLQENAAKFGFSESYPKDNVLDMMYEPWHWAYIGSQL